MELKNKCSRNFLVTFMLAFFGGSLGLHRFYCGKIWTGILYLILMKWSFNKLCNNIFHSLVDTSNIVLYDSAKDMYPHINSDWFNIITNLNWGNIFNFEVGKSFLFFILCYFLIVIDLIILVCGKFRDKEGNIVYC